MELTYINVKSRDQIFQKHTFFRFPISVNDCRKETWLGPLRFLFSYVCVDNLASRNNSRPRATKCLPILPIQQTTYNPSGSEDFKCLKFFDTIVILPLSLQSLHWPEFPIIFVLQPYRYFLQYLRAGIKQTYYYVTSINLFLVSRQSGSKYDFTAPKHTFYLYSKENISFKPSNIT